MVGCTKYDSKLFATVTRQHVIRSLQCTTQQICHGAQAIVTSVVTIMIVKVLEEIDINH
jgi:hypothetical protein